MSLAHALLGLINYHPSTGYQLKDAFEHSINFFWSATLPQIYRTLNQMETEGWLRAEIETQIGKPNRKVYHITDEGYKEFIQWLNSPMEHMELKNPALIKIFFSNKGDPDKVAANLQEMRSYYEALMRMYEIDCAEIIEKAVEEPGADKEGIYWELSRDFGVRWTKMMVEWCDEALHVHKNKLKK